MLLVAVQTSTAVPHKTILKFCLVLTAYKPCALRATNLKAWTMHAGSAPRESLCGISSDGLVNYSILLCKVGYDRMHVKNVLLNKAVSCEIVITT